MHRHSGCGARVMCHSVRSRCGTAATVHVSGGGCGACVSKCRITVLAPPARLCDSMSACGLKPWTAAAVAQLGQVSPRHTHGCGQRHPPPRSDRHAPAPHLHGKCHTRHASKPHSARLTAPTSPGCAAPRSAAALTAHASRRLRRQAAHQRRRAVSAPPQCTPHSACLTAPAPPGCAACPRVA